VIQFQSQALASLQSKVDKNVQSAGDEAKAQANQIPKVPIQQGSAVPEIMSENDRNQLIQHIDIFDQQEEASYVLYARLALGLIVAAAVFSLFGAIFSFAKRHMIGGILGLVVTATISFSNAFPLNKLAAFHNYLQGQAGALKVDCETQRPFTVDSYNSARTRLLALIAARSTQSPGFGNYEVPAQSLSEQQQTIKVTGDLLETAKAELKGYNAGKE
jgi:hypothetical protein